MHFFRQLVLYGMIAVPEKLQLSQQNKNNFDLEEYDRVIFIDDQQRNLESVYAFVDHPGLELYKYNYVREDPATYYPFPRKFPSWVRFNGEDLVNSEPRMGMNFL